MSLKSSFLAALLMTAAVTPVQAQTPAKPRNIIIFVADGLRYGIVNKDTAPTLSALKSEGVDFANSHSLYPTVTTANASVIATGHGIGDTGEWSNYLFMDAPLQSANGRRSGGVEDDSVLQEINGRYNGNYLDEMSLLRLVRDHGYQTAAVGKEGPILIQDIGAMDGKSTIIVDDSTGSPKPGRAVPLDPAIAQAITDAGLSLNPDDHKSNGSMSSNFKDGLKVSNAVQQAWFTGVVTKVILPRFVTSGQPFAMVYWSRDPDGTQHNTGDSIGKPNPGINGPTALSGVRDASDNLQALIDALKAQGVYDNTDIFVTADHGFSTISRESRTSYAATLTFPDGHFAHELPEGFLGIDLAHGLGLRLNGHTGPLDLAKGEHPKGTTQLGDDINHPDVVAIGSGGSEVIYLDPGKAKALAPRIVNILSHEDYVAAIFIDDGLGPIAGTLPMSRVGLQGAALTPRPALYVSFADHTTPACLQVWKNPELCSVLVSDGGLQQGQGQHGGLTRANTRNFMAALGPDFKHGFIDSAPISNADITPTLAHILGFDLPAKGHLTGRVIAEALKGGPATIQHQAHVTRSARTASGFVTVLESQTIGDETYLDAAGKPGRVVGLKTRK